MPLLRPLILLAILGAAALLVWQRTVLAESGGAGPGSTDNSSIAWNLAIVFVLILISGFFAMAEMAFISVRRTRIEQLMEEGSRGARMVSQLLNEPTRMLATIQVGVTLVGLFSAGAAAESAVGPLSDYLRRQAPGTFLGHNSNHLAFFIVVGGVALLTLIIGEITPKSIAIRYAERISLIAAYPVRWLQILAAPIVWFVQGISALLVRPLGVTAGFHSSALSEDELRLLVEQSEEHGVIETEEKEMIHSIFDFADTVARKVMTPRPDITAAEADVTVDELIRVVTESGHSRLPIYDDELDNVVGIIHVKDVLRGISGDGPKRTIRELMREPYFIPENKRVDDLLNELRRTKTQMALVRDEYGIVVGLVTIEDLLEEIVGEIQDEYDIDEAPQMAQVDEHTCIVDGRMTLDDFNTRMGIELPAEESDTLGGFVFGLMGHQPASGEKASWDGLDFEVAETDGRRIQRVKVSRTVANPETPAEPPISDG